ncbi:hypothetical protein ATANTOWER_009342, partial [Ataeniobius toweri]|nr:hypothetical protein [Ataeniobius toweri]
RALRDLQSPNLESKLNSTASTQRVCKTSRSGFSPTWVSTRQVFFRTLSPKMVL